MLKKNSVFISYSRTDSDVVEPIARDLSEIGQQVWLDRWSLVPGESWQEALESAIESSSAIVVFVGKKGVSSSQQEELQSIQSMVMLQLLMEQTFAFGIFQLNQFLIPQLI